MKRTLSLTTLLVCCLLVFAGRPVTLPLLKKADKVDFWHHCGEFHVTPSADYYIYQKGKLYEAPSPYEFQLPFIGFDIGGQYMYRPVELFAVSAGLGFRMQGGFTRHTTTPLFMDKYVDYRSSAHVGFLQLPIDFHLFKRMPNSTFEFSTGPVFNFPVFQSYRSTSYNMDGDKIATVKDKEKFTTSEMREFSSLGWNILLGAELHLCDMTDMFIGPQINFTNLVYFDKDVREGRKDYGADYNCSLGLKLGFRFHCESTPGYGGGGSAPVTR